MKKLSVVGFALGVSMLCAIPVSLRWAHESNARLTIEAGSARAADLVIEPRRYRRVYRHRHVHYAYYSRLYDFPCEGPYTGGGWNGGTYYGGAWIDLGCFPRRVVALTSGGYSTTVRAVGLR